MCTVVDLHTSILASLFAALAFKGILPSINYAPGGKASVFRRVVSAVEIRELVSQRIQKMNYLTGP